MHGNTKPEVQIITSFKWCYLIFAIFCWVTVISVTVIYGDATTDNLYRKKFFDKAGRPRMIDVAYRTYPADTFTVKQMDRGSLLNPGLSTWLEVWKKSSQRKEKLVWRITNHKLPLRKEDCQEARVRLCHEIHTFIALDCDSKCVFFGPEFLAIDSHLAQLYFCEGLGLEGTGNASPNFIFGADLVKKNVYRIKPSFGRIWNKALSPSGRYLALGKVGEIEVIDIGTKESIQIPFDETKRLIAVDPVLGQYVTPDQSFHWISDDLLAFVQDMSEKGLKERKVIEKRFNVATQIWLDDRELLREPSRR